MMKKRVLSLCMALVMCLGAQAQVEKQVEVTKAYVPSLEAAEKLPIAPDMTDTMTLRPEIDYTITPLSLETTLATRPIRPATVTYWEFNRPRPFYLKAAAGVPLQSVLDLYASTQNPGTGYVVGYLQHEGRYGKIKNDFDNRNRAERMTNRVGAAAGTYLGRRVLEGDVSYRHRLDRRFGMYYPKDGGVVGDAIGYSNADFSVRLGDDFLNLSRFNFELKFDGGLFFDHSDPIGATERGRQFNLAGSARLARSWRVHQLAVELGYRRMAGFKGLEDRLEQLLVGGLRYGVQRSRMTLELGLDFYHDRVESPTILDGSEAGNYLLPQVRWEFNLARKALKPFLRIDSRLQTADYQSLTEQNPYVVTNAWGQNPTVEHLAKVGLRGSFGRDRFAYRLYGALELVRNHRYWVMPALHEALPENYFGGWMTFVEEELTSIGFGGELSYRPTTALSFEVGARFRSFEEDTALPSGEAEIEGMFRMNYEHRKFRLGLSAEAASEKRWAYVAPDAINRPVGYFETPFTVDLRLNFEWIFSSSLTAFIEGRNLANQPLYAYPCYPEYGINALVGVRMSF